MFINGHTMSTIVLLANLLHLLGARTCVPKPSCRECIDSPGCAWCTKTDFLRAEEPRERRCAAEEELTIRHCDKLHQIQRNTDPDVLKNNELSNSTDNEVQLKPQNIHIPLIVGVPQTFKVSFKRAEGYPIDLYYLMDLSFSMGDDLDTIKTLSLDIVNTLHKFTSNMRIGFGSFVDKVVLPYVSQIPGKKNNPCPYRGFNCQPAFSYRNILNLTKDAADFKKEVSRQRISGNLDSPEAGFDAIMQAAVCEDVIGWKNVTKILVYTSDDTFHIAGDGRLAGIYEPHDGRCHLNESGFYDGTKFDYPSIGHLARVLKANNIKLVFAVTENIAEAYKRLSQMIPQSVVGVLKSDSSNVVQLITNAYNSLSSTILLEHHDAPQGLAVSYQAHCVPSQGPVPWRSSGECKDIKLNQQVDFTVQLTISECLKEATEFHLSVQGISEKLRVSVATRSECECDPEVPSSPYCSGNGTLRWGECRCDIGFKGRRCEKQCGNTTDVGLLKVACHQDNSPEHCNGRGTCVECGICVCQDSFKGKFCECDDGNCEKRNQKLCGGNGKCSCGKCECFPSHKGEACDCSTSTAQCQKEEGSIICTGHGKCLCNKCQCDNGFAEDFCSTILNACSRYEKCMLCVSEQCSDQEHCASALTENCLEHCGTAELHIQEVWTDAPCSTQTFMYDVKLSPDGIISLRYAHLPRSVDKTWVIIGSSVSGILFIGLAVIVISRLLLELQYRNEYRRFLAAEKETKWNPETNPMYQEATTTTLNPLFVED